MTLDADIADRLLHASDAAMRRPSQIAFAESADEAIRTGCNAVLHAPTGIGKTRGLLAAAISHILRDGKNRAVYAVRTMGQLFQVEAEFNRGWAAHEAHGEDDEPSVLLGLALGVAPMQEKVCTGYFPELAKGGLTHSCEGCPRQFARFAPCHVVGGCQSSDYEHAIEAGLCPYAYMRANLGRSNLVVASTGYVNSRTNMESIFPGDASPERAALLIDEAHSYLDTLGTSPMLRLFLGEDQRVQSLRQPDSELGVDRVHDEFAMRVADAIANTVFQDQARALLGAETQTARDMQNLLRVSKQANKAAVEEMQRAWKEAQSIRSDVHDRVPRTVAEILETAYVVDPFGVNWINQVNRVTAVHAALADLKATYDETMAHKDDAREMVDELHNAAQTLVESRRAAFAILQEAGDIFRRANEEAREANRRWHDAKDRMAEIRASIQHCHNTKELENRASFKERLDSLKERRGRAHDQEQDAFREKKALRDTAQRLYETKESAKSAVVAVKERERLAWERYERARDATREIDKILRVLLDRRDELQGAAHQALAEIDAAVDGMRDALKAAKNRGQALRSLSARVHETFTAIRSRLEEGQRSISPEEAAAGLEDLAVEALGVLDRVRRWSRMHLHHGEVESEFEEDSTFDPHLAASGVAALDTLSQRVTSRQAAWLRELSVMLAVLAHALEVPERYWVSVGGQDDDSPSKGDVIEVTDLDLGQKMEQLIGEYRSVVLASGTLEPVEETAALLGWTDAVCRRFASPFARSNYAAYALVGIHSGVKRQGRRTVRLTATERRLLNEAVPAWVGALQCNTGIFVASESMLADVYDSMRDEGVWPSNVAHLVLSQKNQDLPDDYAALAREVGANATKSLGADADWAKILKGPTERHVVVWMASAGKFSEGIDFPGRMLEAALLIGIPFPYQIDLEGLLKARRDYYFRVGGEALGQLADDLAWYVFPYRKLAQAAGRIHRRTDDTGTLAFVDERLLGLKHDGGPQGESVRRNRTAEANQRSLRILPTHVLERLAVVVPQMQPTEEHLVLKRLKEILPNAPTLPLGDALNHVRVGTHPCD